MAASQPFWKLEKSFLNSSFLCAKKLLYNCFENYRMNDSDPRVFTGLSLNFDENGHQGADLLAGVQIFIHI